MQLEAVDQDQNLFKVWDVVSADLVEQILTTPWMSLQYTKQPAQENWPRRLIKPDQLPWITQWDDQLRKSWSHLAGCLGVTLEPYSGTAFWIDEPGFTCAIHTDGEMPGSLHLMWIGDSDLGTTFYHSKNKDHVRFQNTFVANSGYAMVNLADDLGYRKLQWHGMLHPVPVNSYRLTSYTWLNPVK